jgi:acyl-CoA:acyl-CoA alkyltransferase
MPSVRVRLAGVAAYLPPCERSSAEVEDLVAANSPDFAVPRGIVAATTGIRTRRVADEGVNCSDLAAEAARRLLAQTGTRRDQVDLLIFASASQDLVEPATANIVQEKLGTTCPVFDLKNACNSFLNAVEVGEALIRSGGYHNVLITVGELPSRSIKWSVRDRQDFKLSFPGYTLGDAGAAALLVRSDDERGIFYRSFRTASRYWDLSAVRGGGSMHPRGDDHTYFHLDGSQLKRALYELGPGILEDALAATGTDYTDYRCILVHQVAMPFLTQVLALAGMPSERVVVTLPDLGNMVAASLPVAYCVARERGMIRPGDRLMWFGQAAGISLGVLLMTV